MFCSETTMALALFRRGTRDEAPSGTRTASLAAQLRARDGERLRRYQELQRFYEGVHFTSERRGRTTLVVNYSRAVVDKGVSYLFGRGVHFSLSQSEEGPLTPTLSPLGRGSTSASQHSELSAQNSVEQWVQWVGEECGLEVVLLQAATNASVLGDAVLKVIWDVAAGRPRVVNVDPFCVFPIWASDDPTALREVALVGRLTAEEADERSAVSHQRSGETSHTPTLSPAGRGSSRSSAQNSALRTQHFVETVEVWTPSRFQLWIGNEVVREGENPYGCIPFVLVPNLQPPNQPWGVSDLVDLIPLNRELDERMSDQADVIRYHADPPVVFRGVEEHSDLPIGPGTVWDLPRDAEVSLLEWRGSGPSVQEHLERVLRALYDVAETPRTSFGDSGRLLSGVALETELQPLLQRTLRKRMGWGVALRQVVSLWLRLAERFTPGIEPGSLTSLRSQVVWPPMLPRDDEAEARRNLALVEGGLRARRTALAALGELDPEGELQRIQEEVLVGARGEEGMQTMRSRDVSRGGGGLVLPDLRRAGLQPVDRIHGPAAERDGGPGRPGYRP